MLQTEPTARGNYIALSPIQRKALGFPPPEEISTNTKSPKKEKGKKSNKSFRFAPASNLTSFIEPATELFPSDCIALWWQQEDYRTFKLNAQMDARKEREDGQLDLCIALANKNIDSSALVRWCADGSGRGLERMCGEKYWKATDIMMKLTKSVVLQSQRWKRENGISDFHQLQIFNEQLRSNCEKVTKNSKELALLFGRVDAEVSYYICSSTTDVLP